MGVSSTVLLHADYKQKCHHKLSKEYKSIVCIKNVKTRFGVLRDRTPILILNSSAVLYICTLPWRKSLEVAFLASALCKHTVGVLFHCQKLAIEECRSISSSNKSNHYTETIHISLQHFIVIFRVPPTIWTLFSRNVSIYSGQLGI